MPQRFHLEPLNRGLVTSRDISLLAEGELPECNEAHYRPNTIGLRKVGGRSSVVTAQGGSAVMAGIAFLGFHGVQDRLFYLRQSTGASTVFNGYINATAGGSEARIDYSKTVDVGAVPKPLAVVHYENRFLVGNEEDVVGQRLLTTALSTAASASGVFQLGLAPPTRDGAGIATARPIGSAHADYVRAWNSETFPGSSTAASRFDAPMFYYWVTQYIPSLDMESAATAYIYGDRDATAAPDIGFRRQTTNIKLEFDTTSINGDGTHRRIYRSIDAPLYEDRIHRAYLASGDTNEGDGTTARPFLYDFIGERIATLPATVTSFVDTGGTLAEAFASITVDVLGVRTTTQRDIRPPKWTTGTIFENSLVVNDVDNKGIARYSFPGKPWAFPDIFLLQPPLKENDEVTFIGLLGNECLIALRDNIYRINYLPRETDSEFSRGRPIELLSSNHGIVNEHAATVFTMEASSPRLAFCARTGVWMTDGYTVIPLTLNIDWDDLVDVDNLSNARMQNVPHLWTFVLYYPPKNGNGRAEKALYFSYHPQIVGPGGRPVPTGPVSQVDSNGSTHNNRVYTVQAAYGNDTWYAGINLSATAMIFNLLQGGAATANADAIVKEDQSAISANPMSIKTRMIYPAGLDTDVQIDRLYALTEAASLGATQIRAISRMADRGGTDVTGSFATVTAGQLDRIHYELFGEAFQIHITGNDAPVYVGVRYEEPEQTK